MRAGATIEDLDIFDPAKLLDENDTADMIRVYLNLMKGSRNHPSAFVGTEGEIVEVSDEASYLSLTGIEKILNSAWETGPKAAMYVAEMPPVKLKRS